MDCKTSSGLGGCIHQESTLWVELLSQAMSHHIHILQQNILKGKRTFSKGRGPLLSAQNGWF